MLSPFHMSFRILDVQTELYFFLISIFISVAFCKNRLTMLPSILFISLHFYFLSISLFLFFFCTLIPSSPWLLSLLPFLGSKCLPSKQEWEFFLPGKTQNGWIMEFGCSQPEISSNQRARNWWRDISIYSCSSPLLQLIKTIRLILETKDNGRRIVEKWLALHILTLLSSEGISSYFSLIAQCFSLHRLMKYSRAMHTRLLYLCEYNCQHGGLWGNCF